MDHYFRLPVFFSGKQPLARPVCKIGSSCVLVIFIAVLLVTGLSGLPGYRIGIYDLCPTSSFAKPQDYT